jgi:hypothetical protein
VNSPHSTSVNREEGHHQYTIPPIARERKGEEPAPARSKAERRRHIDSRYTNDGVPAKGTRKKYARGHLARDFEKDAEEVRKASVLAIQRRREVKEMFMGTELLISEEEREGSPEYYAKSKYAKKREEETVRRLVIDEAIRDSQVSPQTPVKSDCSDVIDVEETVRPFGLFSTVFSGEEQDASSPPAFVLQANWKKNGCHIDAWTSAMMAASTLEFVDRLISDVSTLRIKAADAGSKIDQSAKRPSPIYFLSDLVQNYKDLFLLSTWSKSITVGTESHHQKVLERAH